MSRPSAAVIAIAAALSACPFGASAAERSYPASNADFANPERGFWRFAANDFAKVTKGELSDIRRDGMSLAYGIVRLDDFRSKPLSKKLLKSIDAAFDKAREAGVKIILRFAYNYPDNEHEYQNAKDAPLEVVQGHIEQLKPVLARNADAIAVLQAGFIGAWGEGHTSSNKLTTPANKAAVRDALLAALPDGRMLQWRYPGDVIDWSPEPPRPGSLARIGVHNDCFMSSNTDVGTYSSNRKQREKQRDYVADLSRATFFSGETCAVGSGSERRSCPDILSEGPRFHLGALNRDYNANFMKTWKQEGCFDEVSRSMGYRFVLKKAEAPDIAAPGETAPITVRIRNVGWARLHNPRPVEIVATHRETGRSFAAVSPGDIRDVEPEDKKPTAFSFDWRVPADAPAGAYDLALALPDASPSLAENPVFAVRPANGSGAGFGWNDETGRYDLGLEVRVAPR